jgi:hypothetical protein
MEWVWKRTFQNVEGPVHFKRYNAKFRAVSVLKIQKKKSSWSLLNKKGMVHGTCKNNYKQTCKCVLNDNAHGTYYF